MIQNLKDLIKKHWSLLLILSFYFILVLIVSPFQEHAVNDDWQFYTHVRYFTEGNFKKNSLIDASFILQGIIGAIWANIFGLSFVSLRVLTLLFTIIFLVGFYKVLKFYNLKHSTILIGTTCLFLEPLFITSSFSFMTEIYFLTFSIWAYFFLISGLQKKDVISFEIILATILAALSILIRQFGLVYFIAFSLLFLYQFNNKKIRNAYLFFSTIVFVTAILINFTFPQYSGRYESITEKISSLLASPLDIFSKISLLPLYLPYLAFFLTPLILSLKFKSFNYKRTLLVSVPVALIFFWIDIFNLKNVFHIECLYCELNFRHSTSLLDNIYLKGILSLILAFSVTKLGEFMYISKIKKNLFNNIITNPDLLICLGMILIIFFVDSFYERYFINFNLFLIVALSNRLESYIYIDKLTLTISIFFILIIMSLNIDFYNYVSQRWKLSQNLYSQTGLKGQIFTVGSFYRYLNAQENPPEQLFSSSYMGIHKCFITRYILEDNNFLRNLLESKFFPILQKIPNPTFSNTGILIEIPKIDGVKHKLVEYQSYSSPIFNLIGRKTYVVSFCTDEVNNRYNIKTKEFKE